jgi:membrane protease YdiL (CAAX protease family)
MTTTPPEDDPIMSSDPPPPEAPAPHPSCHSEQLDTQQRATAKDERAVFHPGGMIENSPGQVRLGGRSPGLQPKESSSPVGATRITEQPVHEERSAAESKNLLLENQSDEWDTTNSTWPDLEELPSPESPAPVDQPLFQSFTLPEVRPTVRIPHLGHLAMLGAFAVFGLFGASALIFSALHFHWLGVTTQQQAAAEIHYTLGSELVLYGLMFVACLIFFPLLWQKGFFAGIQWNGAIALQLRNKLFVIASICCALALANGLLLPGPKDAPIEKIFRSPGAAWLLFAFGVTIAPFFEELIFRGFLLPALCTAFDWIAEKIKHTTPRHLDQNGQPHWSLQSMIIGSIATSAPFAAMHAAQTGYSWGPFVLLVGVSLVLCWARLSTRSLAASVFVHASYNFLLFTLMMLGTSGFRHMDKM